MSAMNASASCWRFLPSNFTMSAGRRKRVGQLQSIAS
jgi:hypothetical protein